MIFIRSIQLGTRFMAGKGRQNISKHIIGAILGIAISLIPLVVVLEVTGGMISGITRRYLEIGTYHLQIRNYVSSLSGQEEEAVKIISKIQGVKTVFPVVQGVGLAYSPEGRTGVSIKALPEDYWEQDKDIHQFLSIVSGSFDLSTADSAMLSRGTAEKLKVKAGDRIKILTAKKLGSRKTLLKPSYFTVKGIFSTGYYELDSLSVYISRDRGLKLFSDPMSHYIGVKIVNPDTNIEQMAGKIRRVLKHNWFVFTWYDLEKPMYESFKTTQSLLLFIMLLIVLVAAVNISSALIMMVMEKETDVAILKSTGVSGKIITSAYLYSGFAIGFIGTFTGIAAGLLLAVNINELIHGIENLLNILSGLLQFLLTPFSSVSFGKIVLIDSTYYLDHIPVKINFTDIFIIGSASILLSTIAALIPAVRAGRIKPMEVIRRQ